MTVEQYEILKHAVAWHTRTKRTVKAGSWPWRNHYCTGPDCDGYADVLALVKGGYMHLIIPAREGALHSQEIFRVTKQGMDYLNAHP
jgi:hypothetical protein